MNNIPALYGIGRCEWALQGKLEDEIISASL
jgi:hypothetical protein